MKYFAYGSNCDPAIMAKKEVRYTAARPAVLNGYRLLFNKLALRTELPAGIGYANINEAPGGVVEGVLYDVAVEDLAKLDASERHPAHYRRINVTVRSRGSNLACMSYQAQPDKIATGLRPSRDYLDHILAGREILSSRYVDKLARSPTYRATCGHCRQMAEIVFVKQEDQMLMLCHACQDSTSPCRE